jgi:hypothetical protein
MRRYLPGTKLICNEVNGIVIENFKLSGDICVEWETGLKSSYDEEWLDEFTKIKES